MLIAPALVGIVLSICSTSRQADAALNELKSRDDLELGEVELRLSRCAPLASPPLQAWAKAYAEQCDRVRKLERKLLLLYPLGGKTPLQDDLGKALKEAADYPLLVARVMEDRRAMDRVEAAFADAEAGKWSSASRRFREARADPAVSRVINEEIRARLHERSTQAEAELGAWAEIKAWMSERAGPLRMLGATFLGALLVLGVRAGLTRLSWSRGKGPRYDIVIHDGTKAGTDADAVLAARLVGELRLLHRGTSLTTESAGALGSFLVMHPPEIDEQLRGLASRIDANASITLGLIKVPMKELWLGLVRLTFRPRFIWRGVLTRHIAETLFTLSQEDRQNPRAAPTWSVRVDGVDDAATSHAIRQMAYRLAHAALEVPPTWIPEAFASYQAARGLLDDLPEDGSREVLEKARGLLELAIRQDHAMTSARLQLAGVCSRLGEIDLAAEIVRGLRAQPEADSAELRYEEARIFAQYDDYRRVRRALKAVEAILQQPKISPTLQLNARSLRAVSAAGLLAMASRDDDGSSPLGQIERERLKAALESEATFFAAPAPDGLNARAFNLAGALARTAQGTMMVRLKSFSQALNVFRSVLATHPDLLAAQLGLVEAYRKQRPRGWFDQIEPWLQRAAKVAPDSARVHYEYGSALLQRDPPDVDAALEHLTKAAKRHASALYKLGEVTAGVKREGLAGIRLIDGAIRARGSASPPYWPERLIRLIAELDVREAEALSLAEDALRWLLNAVSETDAPEREPPDDRAARLALRRRLRKYLERSAAILGETVGGLAAESLQAAKKELPSIRAALDKAIQVFTEDLKSGDIDPREREGLSTALARVTAAREKLGQ